jgi:hypothetical protein
LEPESTVKDTDEDAAKDQDSDATQLLTPAGMLRVRGIFIKEGIRIALLESLHEKKTDFIEVQENDHVHGYRVIETGPGYIRLSPEDGGDPVKLVIFDR